MSRKIDIEITSISGETATWRAAGAREPKGVVNVSLLGAATNVGTIYRAEIEQFMEGVDVLSVAPPRSASPLDPRQERLALLTPEPKGPDVQVTYAPKGRGRRDDGAGRRDGGAPRRDGTRPSRPERRDRTSTASRHESRTPAAGAGDDQRTTAGGASSRPAARAPRERRPSARTERPAGRSRPAGGPTDRRSRPEGPPVTTVHRNAFLATLTSEHLPIAEELLRGGMPAVRKALDDQNRTATAQGRDTVNAEAITRVAEEMLGRANLANWKDRAAGALSAGKELRLRDLRAVVTSAKTVILDDEGKAQFKELQQALTVRVTALRDEWNAKLQRALEGRHVLEALELTVRTPEPSARVSSEAATKIAALASESLSAELEGATWRAIVTAAISSPICRLIKPTGIPDDDESRALAVRSAGSIPEIAKLLGMRVPPPPTPTRASRRSVPPRRSTPPRRSS